MSSNPYEQQLDKNAANYAPLTPLVFLDWSADALFLNLVCLNRRLNVIAP